MYRRIVRKIVRLYRRATNQVASLDTAAAYWGEQARERGIGDGQPPPMVGWLDSPFVLQHYVYPQFDGGGTEDWLSRTARRYFPAPVEQALSLGCGGGHIERHGLALNIARRFDGVDVSEEAVALARERARREGWEERAQYIVSDLNRHVFPPDAYDAVFAAMGLHHIQAMEFHLDQVRRALRPGGLFILNEYVGPNQFQWTDAQLALANAALQTLPREKRRVVRDGSLRRRIRRPSVRQMNLFDPTESVRSSEIVALVSERFEIVERVDYGGPILHLVLDGIVGNFGPGETDAALLEELFAAERRALENGGLSSDFTYIVARNRG